MSFVHLHLHTEYSLLDGFARISTIMDKAVEARMPAIAITDHGNMFGVVEFYKEAKKKGIQPIIGCEIYVGEGKEKSHHLVLLVKNQVGYANLVKMVSYGYTDNFYYRPRVPKSMLETHSEGLIALSACLQGEVNAYLKDAMFDQAREAALYYRSVFKEDFYLEMQNHQLEDQIRINPLIDKLSKELSIEVVATNDVHYTDKEDSLAHDILLCIGTGKTLSDTQRMRFPNREFYLKTKEEMEEMFSEYPRAISNTLEVAKKCQFDFTFHSYHLPQFSQDPDFSSEEKLRELALEGLEKKYENPLEHLKRLEYELKIINDMGYNDYFLIVWDFVRFAKEQGIFVGPGRGSGGGSIVGYCLDITTVDPIKYNLIFERFLNPERITMPDFDIDFEDERRQEVIDYVNQRYGRDHVAQIITFGTLGARAAIRDAGRVMGIPYAEVDAVAKAVPFSPGMTLEKALKESPALVQMMETHEQTKELILNAKKIEGVPRHASTHAAGVVISKKPVMEYVPLYVHDDFVTTQFPMTTVEELGLVKMDFLGLRNLSILKNTLKNIEATKKIHLDLEAIPTDDPKTYELLSSGDTLGIFQLESAGMRSFFKELKPKEMEDIIAGISLYRPGPMDSIPKYIRNKENPKGISYESPLLEPILKTTYGCLIYQEQVMQIVRDLAGYSYAQADLVRRAMSKKIMQVMEEERKKFIYGSEGNIGAIHRGVKESSGNVIFDDMIDFAKYAFNKSHAAGYAIVAYQTAYLKTHYPLEFMAALMSTVMGNEKKLAQYIADGNSMGIVIKPPSVNDSYHNFTVEGQKLRFGLLAIKNVGSALIQDTVEKRKESPFINLDDYLERIKPSLLNRRAMEAMIKGGAFDFSGESKKSMLLRYESAMEDIQSRARNNAQGQMDLFGFFQMPSQKMDLDEFPSSTLLEFEKEVLGVYLSGHPISKYTHLIKQRSLETLAALEELGEEEGDGKRVSVLAMKRSRRVLTTKKGDPMAFLEVEDETTDMEVIIFPDLFKKVESILANESFYYITGTLTIEEEKSPKIIARDILPIEEYAHSKTLFLKVEKLEDSYLDSLKSILRRYPGETAVVLYHETTKQAMTFKDVKVKEDERLMKTLEKALGRGHVIVK